METINFWLENCVLKQETTQYPQRMTMNAWHLADNPLVGGAHMTGFSGTSDNHRLLPLQVSKYQFFQLNPTRDLLAGRY
jgi:hypothetical protein